MNVPETAALLEPADPFATLCRLDRLCRAGSIRPSPEASWSEVESPEAAQVLVFETDGWLLALPQPWVTEVLRRPRLTRIPNAPDAIQGVTNLRGMLVPVLGVTALMGWRGGGLAPPLVVCLAQGSQILGLGVQTLHGLQSLASGLRHDGPTPRLLQPAIWCGGVVLSDGRWAGVPDWPTLLRVAHVNPVT